jgi:hypothetical protein
VAQTSVCDSLKNTQTKVCATEGVEIFKGFLIRSLPLAVLTRCPNRQESSTFRED